MESKYFATLLPRSALESAAASVVDDGDGSGDGGGGGGLSERLYGRARELISWENSWAQAAVLPAQIILVSLTAVRWMTATGSSATMHQLLAGLSLPARGVSDWYAWTIQAC